MRKGGPLSALLFIVVLELLLDPLKSNLQGAKQATRRIISHADDVSVFVNKNNLGKLFDTIEKFCGTQFRINKDKNVVLTSEFADIYTCSNTVKIVG